jgi:hypothetical protein
LEDIDHDSRIQLKDYLKQIKNGSAQINFIKALHTETIQEVANMMHEAGEDHDFRKEIQKLQDK